MNNTKYIINLAKCLSIVAERNVLYFYFLHIVYVKIIITLVDHT